MGETVKQQQSFHRQQSIGRATGSVATWGVDQCAMAHRSFPDPSYMGMVLTTSAVRTDTMTNAAVGCQNPNCYKLFQADGVATRAGTRTTNSVPVTV